MARENGRQVERFDDLDIDEEVAEFFNSREENDVEQELVYLLRAMRNSPRPRPAPTWYAVPAPGPSGSGAQAPPNPQAPPHPIWRPYALDGHFRGVRPRNNPADVQALPYEYGHLRICNGCAVAAKSKTPELIDINGASPELSAPFIPDWLFRESDEDEGISILSSSVSDWSELSGEPSPSVTPEPTEEQCDGRWLRYRPVRSVLHEAEPRRARNLMAARLQHLHSCAHALHRLHNWHKLHKAYHALGHITTFINAEMVKTQRRDLEPVLNWVEMMQHLGNCHRASETITTRSRPSVRSTEPRVRRLRRRNRRARARAMKRVPPNSRNREGGMKEGPPKSRTAAAGWSRDFDMPGPSRGFDTPGPSRGFDMPGPSRGFHTSGPPRHRNYDDMRERDQARKRDSVPTCCICHGRSKTSRMAEDYN